MGFRRARLAVTALFAATALVMPGVARASGMVRTVCPLGCDFTSINMAVNQSNADDFIKVMPGTYPEQVIVTVRLHIFAPADEPRPVITSSQAGITMLIQPDAAGSTLSHLDIRGIGSTNSMALYANGAVSATDLALADRTECAVLAAGTPSQLGPGVTATGGSSGNACVTAGAHAPDTVTGVAVDAPDAAGVELVGSSATLTDSTVNAEEALDAYGGTVRRTTLNGAGIGLSATSRTATLVSDSVVTSSRDGGIAILASGGPGGPLELRNVTAVAGGSSSTGLGAPSAPGPGGTGAAIDARNVIARGTANGAFGEPGPPSSCGGPCPPGAVTLGYSNVNDPGGVIDTTTVGHNQTGDPLLVNPTVGLGQDFHIVRASSPVIGAGTPDPGNGATDRDGVTHPNPPSIGAYEFAGSTAPSAGGNGQPGGAGGNAGGPGGNAGAAGAGATTPTISALTETNRVFAVGRASTAITGRTASARTKRGTVFSFLLDQPATLTIAIRIDVRGRRRCHSGSPEAGGERRCTPIIMVATLTRSADAGRNRVPFSGRIGRRPLKKGRYEAAFTATDGAGNSSVQVLRFVVVKR
jgi:hypothetical protein